LTINQKGSII